MSADPDRLDVVAAVIVREGRLLLTQRDPKRSPDFHWLWECPGGKVDPADEGSHVTALLRELREELGVELPPTSVAWAGPLCSFTFDPPVCPRPTRVTFYVVDLGRQRPTAREAVGLGWFGRREMLALDLTPGNRAARGAILPLLGAVEQTRPPACRLRR